MRLSEQPVALSRLASLGFAKMQNFRKARIALLAQYVGRFYGKHYAGTGSVAMPLNLMHQAVTTLVPNLVYKNPQAKASSKYLAYRPYADLLGLATNQALIAIELRETIRKIITDSIFLAGFSKTGLGVSGQTLEIDGLEIDVGQVYSERVDPDDMILDPTAKDWKEQKFLGNRYRVDKDILLELGLSPQEVKKLSSRFEDYHSYMQAANLSNKPNALVSEADTYLNSVDLCDLWIPQENVIVTMPWFPGNEVGDTPIRVVEYEGPQEGLYQMLGYAFVPDNIMPVAPAMIWHDLHLLANKMARKMAQQAERSKRVLVYESSAWQDAMEIVDAEDGDNVRVDNVEGVKEIGYGGASEDLYNYIAWVKTNFSEMAMNIDLLAGTSTNEPTATQAEMVQANTSVRLADMQELVYQFTSGILNRIAFFIHTDPLIDLPMIRRVQGVDQQVSYTPEMRMGEWLDYNIKVVPYSMARQDPNLKVRRVMEFAGQVIPALAQAYQMLGPAFNLEAAINLLGREMGIEELDEIINSQALQLQMATIQAAISRGIPMSPKLMQMMMGADQGGGNAGGAAGGPNNPGSMMAGNITPTTETNQRQQEMAGELQATYVPGSAAAGAQQLIA